MTTLRADAPQLGAVAFGALAAVMAGEEVGGQTLPVELVVRDSTALSGGTFSVSLKIPPLSVGNRTCRLGSYVLRSIV